MDGLGGLLSLAMPSGADLSLVPFGIAFAAVYGILFGRGRAFAAIVSTYVAIAAVSQAPALRSVAERAVAGAASSYGMVAVVLIAIGMPFAIAMRAMSRVAGGIGSRGPWWHASAFGIVHAGLLVSVGMAALPQPVLLRFSLLAHAVFLSDAGRSVWMLAPLVLMAWVAQRNPEEVDLDEIEE
jgi:hypothetical protein